MKGWDEGAVVGAIADVERGMVLTFRGVTPS